MEIDFAALFVSGIIIGTIGVVMDVSMSITSLVFELKENSPEMSFPKLVSSGLNVGKDMMATMINTLVLAYVGTSLPAPVRLHYSFIFSHICPQYGNRSRRNHPLSLRQRRSDINSCRLRQSLPAILLLINGMML